MSENYNKFVRPVTTRYIILDALRGFALLGICLANFPEFSLYTFLPREAIDAMASSGIDKISHAIMLLMVDGKFYTIFSLLFGIGFSIILNNVKSKGLNGNRMFVRRMLGLCIIGFAHLMLLWSGDILLLYALMGLFLPLFFRCSDRGLLIWSALMLSLPILCDIVAWSLNDDPASFAYDNWWRCATAYGITEDNFATWLRDSNSYGGVHKFLMQGACERLWEFVDSNRYFKVLGLFILGAYIGRNKLYLYSIENYNLWMKTSKICLIVGIPLSVVYMLSGMDVLSLDRPIKSVIYAVSVYPLGIAYCALMCILQHKSQNLCLWRWLAYPGRMALTNYVMQSVFGMMIFYGIGLGFGTSIGLFSTLLIAFCVYVTEVVLSCIWLKFFSFGPIEWIWRMWNYGKYLPILKKN